MHVARLCLRLDDYDFSSTYCIFSNKSPSYKYAVGNLCRICISIWTNLRCIPKVVLDGQKYILFWIHFSRKENNLKKKKPSCSSFYFNHHHHHPLLIIIIIVIIIITSSHLIGWDIRLNHSWSPNLIRSYVLFVRQFPRHSKWSSLPINDVSFCKAALRFQVFLLDTRYEIFQFTRYMFVGVTHFNVYVFVYVGCTQDVSITLLLLLELKFDFL